jgi:hypothetical protein
MKLKPLNNYHDYLESKKYLESCSKVKLTSDESDESDKVKILSVLIEEYERRQNPILNSLDIDPLIDNIFDRVKDVSKYEAPGILERGLKLGEEFGELSAEILKLSGYKKSDETSDKIKYNILLESSDCMIMIFDIMIEMGFSKKEIIDMSDKQINKWLSYVK